MADEQDAFGQLVMDAPPAPREEADPFHLLTVESNDPALSGAMRRQGHALEEATTRHQGEGESLGGYLSRRSLPLVSSLVNVGEANEYQQAVRRFRAGQASDQDINSISAYEQMNKNNAERGIGGQILSGLATIPALVGEGMIAGGATRGLSALTGIGSRTAATTLGRVGQFLGTRAAQAPFMPSLYVENWIGRNQAAGRDPLDLEGLPPAMAIGGLQNMILGTLGGVGNNITGNTVGAFLRRTTARVGTGLAEQQGVDLLTGAITDALGGAAGMETSYGVLGDLMQGRGGDALKHLVVQAATFAAFAGLHDLQHGAPRNREQMAAEQIMRTLADGLSDVGRRGGSGDAAAREMMGRLRGPMEELAQTTNPTTDKINEIVSRFTGETPEPSRTAPAAPEAEHAPAFHITDYKQPERSAATALDILARKGTPPRPLEVWSGKNVQQRFEGQMISQGHTAFEFNRNEFTGEQTHAPMQGRMTSTDPLRYNPGLKRVIYKGKESDPAYGRLREMVKEVNYERGDAELMREHGHSGALDPVELALHKPGEAEKTSTAPKTWEADTLAALKATGHKAAEAKLLVEQAKASGWEFGSPGEAIAAITRAQARAKQGLDPWAPEAKLPEPAPAPEAPPEPAAVVPDPYEQAGMSPLEAKVHELRNEVPPVPFEKLKNHPEVMALNGGQPLKSPDYVYKKAKAKKDAFDAIQGIVDDLEKKAASGDKIDPEKIELPPGTEGMHVLAETNKRQREINEANDMLARLLQQRHLTEGHPDEPKAYEVFLKLNRTLEKFDEGKGHAKFIEALIAARKFLKSQAGGAGQGAESGPGSAAGEASLRRRRGESVPADLAAASPAPAEAPRPEPEVRPGSPAPEGAAAAHELTGWEGASELLAPLPEKTKAWLTDIHASGDPTAWQQAKDALRRNIQTDEAEAFVRSLGNQKVTKGRTKARGDTWEKQGTGEERMRGEDDLIQRHMMEHDAPEELSNVERSGQEAGIPASEVQGDLRALAEEIDVSARNAFQKRQAEAARQRQAAEAGQGAAELSGPSGSYSGPSAADIARGIPFKRQPGPGEQFGRVRAEEAPELPGGMGAAGGPSPAGNQPPAGTPGAGVAPPPQAPTPTSANWFQRAADWLKSFAGRSFPGLTRLSQGAGEKLAERTNAKHASDATYDYISRVVNANGVSVHEMSQPDRLFIGAVIAEKRTRLLREAKRKVGEDASDVVTFVGSEGSPLRTEADYQEGLKTLWSFFESAKQEWTPEVDRNYRGILGLEPEDEINSRSQIPQLPFNMIRLTAEDVGKPGVVSSGRGQSMSNLRIRKPGFTQKAELNGEAYDLDIAHMMKRTLDTGIEAARTAEFIREATRDGVIEQIGGAKKPKLDLDQQGPEPPVTDKPSPGFRYLGLDPATGMAGIDPNARYYGHPDTFRDIIQGLGIGERPGQTLASGMKPFVDKIYSVSLMAPVELLTHIANHVTAMFRSGMGIPILNIGKSIVNFVKVWRGDPEMMRKVMELSKISASFGHEARAGILGEKFQKYDPTAYINKFTSKFIDTMQKAVRVQLGDAYDKMVQSGSFKESETAKRDFINGALGNYNTHANNRLTQFLKDIGMQSFATAAHTFTVQGIKSLWGGAINAPAQTWGKAFELRTIAAIKFMPILAMGPIINSLFWGQAFPKNVPAFAIKLGDDPDKTTHYDPLSFTGLRRGARATGVNALVEGLFTEQAGPRRNQTMLDRAAGDAWLSLAHLFEGPPMQFLHTAHTGENVFGRHIAPKAGPGEHQSLLNLRTAAQNVNPLIGTFTGGDRQRMPRTFLENVFQSLGPFGVRSRKRY